MTNPLERRRFLQISAAGGAAVAMAGIAHGQEAATQANKKNAGQQRKGKLPFRISLAEWSLHRTLRSGKLDNLDFAKTAKEEFKINAVEYVNQFFKDKAEDKNYLGELKLRHDDFGVKCPLIMIDGEGALGDPDDAKRTAAVENHYKWVEAAKFLGCHSIRVNAQSNNDYEEAKKLAADGLRRLSEFGAKHDINIIVENHGGLSSNGKWLAETISSVGLDNCGTLPDFGNFHDYDRYQGVTETMPFAKSVSAKSHDFDAEGNETKTDYTKMMKIVLDAGYHSWVGIEYEGSKLDEYAGIKATKKLLMKVRREFAEA
ncbi:sugar phosphate isomerase/epimerase family protein [Aureliella helgolandensis]|uniref:Xylose isomerase-like TIM barrel n=1 Tax=Aureliella helgolandensis TaxID=2527968 RepID=A0A518GCB8_9BACT|nr:sugar phosphate isomerase/epimerase family protein [Aureliella helgolandensis]QDV26244.1 Xylose isomerase-like TIM barrel [Aureliella helgolandensis]